MLAWQANTSLLELCLVPQFKFYKPLTTDETNSGRDPSDWLLPHIKHFSLCFDEK